MTATFPADRLIAPHGVTDDAKVEALVADMMRLGWVGRPVLVLDDGNGLHAWTGSHRIAAARIAGVDVPCLVMAPPTWEQWSEAGMSEDDIFGAAECRDDDERLAVLESLGAEYADPAALMAAEIA